MVKKNIQDPILREHLERLPGDLRSIFILDGGNFRLTAIQATAMVNQMRANFGLPCLETWILGQAYVAGGLLSGEVKGRDRLILSVECGGPLKGLSVEAWACGAVRGYLATDSIKLEKPLRGNDLSDIYGPGFLSVTKILEGSKTPFKGTVMMEHGDLAKDLAVYYDQSEQTPTVFDLSLKFDNEGRVVGAGGFFVQVLPGCPEESLSRLEALVPALPPIGARISQGVEMKDYVAEVFASFQPKLLARSFVGFSCPCSRENFLNHLKNLPKKEKDAILKEDKFPLVVSCLNCGTSYSFQKEEIL